MQCLNHACSLHRRPVTIALFPEQQILVYSKPKLTSFVINIDYAHMHACDIIQNKIKLDKFH